MEPGSDDEESVPQGTRPFTGGGKKFLYASREPRVGDEVSVVRLDRCDFDEQGRASIQGKSIEKVRISALDVDRAVGGLHYAETASSSNARRASGGPARRAGAGSAGSVDRVAAAPMVLASLAT